MQFGVRGDVGLDEHDTLGGIESGGEPIEENLDGILFQARRIGVVGGEGVPIGDEEEAVVLILHANPVDEGADIIAEVKFAGGAHSAEHALLGVDGHDG